MEELSIAQCRVCKQEKDRSHFHKCKSFKTGITSICKTCTSNRISKYLAQMSPEEREAYRAKRRMDYHLNKERRRQKHLQWLADPENARQALKKAREYKINNRAAINGQRRKRYQNDIEKRIDALCRSRIRYVLKGIAKKSVATQELIGCSFEYLKRHIENQFKPGMTWKNMGRESGTWQLDHIEPCCSFDLTDPEQQKQAFNYTNLQPLWYDDHKIKSGKDRRKARKYEPIAA